MTKDRKKIAFIPFIIAITFVAVIVVIELIVPLDRLHTASNEEFQNAAMGGKVCTENDIVYYVSSSGAVRAKGAALEFKVADSGDMLAPWKDGLLYRDGKKAVYSDISGGNKRTVLDNVGDYFLSGNWLYYTEAGDNKLKKIRLTDNKKSDIGITVNGDFAVRGNTIIYIGEKNYLYIARTDGSNNRPFLGKKVDSFMFYGNYIYFMHEGEIWSTATQNTANMLIHGKADVFTVYNNTLFYVNDGQLYSRNLVETNAKPKKLETSAGTPCELYVSEDNFYYYLADGSLYRCDFYGTSTKKM